MVSHRRACKMMFYCKGCAGPNHTATFLCCTDFGTVSGDSVKWLVGNFRIECEYMPIKSRSLSSILMDSAKFESPMYFLFYWASKCGCPNPPTHSLRNVISSAAPDLKVIRARWPRLQQLQTADHSLQQYPSNCAMSCSSGSAERVAGQRQIHEQVKPTRGLTPGQGRQHLARNDVSYHLTE